MEKSAYNAPYPQAPAAMNASSSYNAQPAPPSYEQATNVGGYPPVQVLPTPPPNTWNGTPQQQQQAPNTQVYVGMNPNAIPNSQYVGVTVGGGGGHANTTIPPPVSYPRQQQHGVTQPMVQQPVVIIQQQAMIPLGPEPAYVVCPFCHIQKMTRIEYEPSSKTHLMAALLCLIGLWCCVCLPYCAESCMNANHYCGNCNKFLGTYADSL